MLLTSEPIERFDEVFAAHAGQTETCAHVTATNPECTWEVEGAVGSALLIGDSNAHHFVEGFVAGMHERSFDATLAYSPGCTFSALDMHAWGEARPHCADFHAAALRDLAGNPHDLVVVATAVDLYVEDDGVQLRASTAGEFESDAGVKARLLADAYAASFSELGALDVDVVFVRSVPQLGDWYPHECSAITWMNTESGCGISLSWAEVDAYSARGSAVESHALDVSGLRSVDFTEFLCGIDGCSAVVDGEWRWKDRGHLTVEQSLALSSSFAALVSR